MVDSSALGETSDNSAAHSGVLVENVVALHCSVRIPLPDAGRTHLLTD